MNYLIMTDSHFIRIAITIPGPLGNGIADEASEIVRMLDDGVFDIVHIRKIEGTDWKAEDTERLLNEIPERLHPRLRLHHQVELTQLFPLLAGVQTNSRDPEPPATARSWSSGCHTLQECREKLEAGAEYVTLSPVYDSISKPGYKGKFACGLPEDLHGKGVIALGGITPDKEKQLKKWGFSGFAMLGAVWRNH